jgi:hypothetical protein
MHLGRGPPGTQKIRKNEKKLIKCDNKIDHDDKNSIKIFIDLI